MPRARSLRVIMPNVPAQRWECRSCGNCCRTLVVHVTPRERAQLDDQGWRQALGVAPYVRAGRSWALNQHEDGACVFLDNDNRCRIHAEHGPEAKPLACRIFPFSLRPDDDALQASLRFDCPSVAASVGKPISDSRTWLTALAGNLHESPPSTQPPVRLQRSIAATPQELDALARAFSRWLNGNEWSMTTRLTGAARMTATLDQAKLAKVRGVRFADLLDVLFQALPSENKTTPQSPTDRQRGMLRQLAFAHAEHTTLAQLRSRLLSRLLRRWSQLLSARRLLKGFGPTPRMPGFDAVVSIETVESVEPATDRREDIADLIHRYVIARLAGRSVYGSGYYDWSVITGLAALWLSVAAAGWLARLIAIGNNRTRLTFDDAARAIGIVDRAATRLPALGTVAERARIAYLIRDDGVARLNMAYAMVDDTP